MKCSICSRDVSPSDRYRTNSTDFSFCRECKRVLCNECTQFETINYDTCYYHSLNEEELKEVLEDARYDAGIIIEKDEPEEIVEIQHE